MVFGRGRKRGLEDDEAEAPTRWSPWNFMPQRKRARPDAEERTCRLCYGGEEDGPLVQPCACRGTAKWVHNHCLEAWRRTAEREDAAYLCVQCMDHYRDALSIELLRKALEMRREILGSRHPGTLTSIDDLNVLVLAKFHCRVAAGFRLIGNLYWAGFSLLTVHVLTEATGTALSEVYTEMG